jgi:hypothetical protein
MARALNEEVQELVSQALEGAKLSMVEASVYKAAEELQGLQKGVATSKETMRRTLESESDTESRRAAAGRLLFSQKKDLAKATCVNSLKWLFQARRTPSARCMAEHNV